jgi:hypothetical protein
MGVFRSPLVSCVTGARLAHYDRAEKLPFDPRAALRAEEINFLRGPESERTGPV